jgi:hypothetical protein
MRLISADSYSYGEGTFPWFGLLDPKLFQRYTWLLPQSIYAPVLIPTIGVSAGRVIVGITSPSQDIIVFQREILSSILSPEKNVRVSSVVHSPSVSSQGVSVGSPQKKTLLEVGEPSYSVTTRRGSTSVSI